MSLLFDRDVQFSRGINGSENDSCKEENAFSFEILTYGAFTKTTTSRLERISTNETT